MGCFRGSVLILAVLNVLCTQCMSSGVTAKVGDSTEATLTFERTCINDNDCDYEILNVRDRVFLACKEGKCQCRNPSNYLLHQDIPLYSVRVLNDECVASDNVPCGTSDGIKLVCEDGRTCIEGRCRRPSQIRSSAKGFYCDEDIDCQEGLKCVLTFYNFVVGLCKEGA